MSDYWKYRLNREAVSDAAREAAELVANQLTIQHREAGGFYGCRDCWQARRNGAIDGYLKGYSDGVDSCLPARVAAASREPTP